MDLFDDNKASTNAPEFTVSELTGSVKKTLEGTFGRVRVRGEVGRVMIARSGHIYYDIKDDRNVIACTTWKGQVPGLGITPEEGLEVIVTGKLSTFGPQSKYNINVDSIEVAGEGALMAMLEKRKKALAAEGLFEPERKKDLPFLPEIIGVVTSPSGAVIRDILHRLRDRFPRKVLVWPVAVQGKACAPEVANAIRGFNQMTPGGALPRPDLIIVARGGGSLEDLWGFNEESVARAAADSQIPLISAVGHETDTTLIDFVSDMRAPTPTAAAEMAVPVRLELMAWVDQQGARLRQSLTTGLTGRRQRVTDLARGLPRRDSLLDGPRQRLDVASDKLPAALRSLVAGRELALSRAAGALRPTVLQRRMSEDRRRLDALSNRLQPALSRRIERATAAYDSAARGLRPAALGQELIHKSEKLDVAVRRLAVRARDAQDARLSRLEALDRLRETLGYRETLKRGYAVVRGDGNVVSTTTGLQAASSVEVEFADGKIALATGP